MPQRLPIVGADANGWGTVLDGYLQVGHDSTGKHLKRFYTWEYGTTLDDVAINAAIAAAQSAGGGVVQLEDMTYNTAATILLPASNITLQGFGWNTVIKPASGANFDAICTTVASSGPTYHDIWVRDLTIDCSQMTGTTAGAGNGAHFCGAINSGAVRVHVKTCKNYAFVLEGGQGGYNCYVTDCLTDSDCAGGVWMGQGCEANFIRGNQFAGCGGTGACAALQPAFGTQTQQGADLYTRSGVNFICENVFGNGGATTVETVHIENTMNRIIGNKFDSPRYQAMELFGDHHMVIGNEFNNCSQIGSTYGLGIDGNYNHIIGNDFRPSGGGNSHYTYAIKENGGPFTGNVIEGNYLDAGTSGVISQNATSTNLIANNAGYNPLSALAAPAAPTLSTNATGGTLTAGTYQVEITYVNAFGETLASASSSQAISGTQELVISPPAPRGNARGWYAYVTQAGGSTYFRQQAAGSPSSFGSNLTLTTNPTTSGANPPGANTTGGVTTPSVPGTGGPQANNTGVGVTVYVTGGTVSAIAIGGTTTGFTSGTFRLPPGQTITLTYTVAPTWVWIGE